jgi:hypothetical protein
MLETEATKTCFKCGETKKRSMFYKHPQMADGHLNKCKECNKKDVIENRGKKLDYYRSYDNERGSRRTFEDTKKYRENNPLKYRAHSLVGYAMKTGKLIRTSCEVCEAAVTQAHHDDYLKPLDVRWLCAVCQCAWHKEQGQGLNG